MQDAPDIGGQEPWSNVKTQNINQPTRSQDAARHSIHNDDGTLNEAHGVHPDSLIELPAEIPETALHFPANESAPLRGSNNERQLNALGNTYYSTQPISQSFYTTLIRKIKSHSLPEDEDDSAETQKTLEEGDHGHVDLTSSFVTGTAQRGEEEDDEEEEEKASNTSEPLPFSPTQSQHNLTQFPESERFKTPAPIGKKRNYRGELIESPVLSRNPLRDDAPTPADVVGLSQVFAGTQAASSPFSNGLPTGPRSDRPSPNIELQIKAATAVDSSPLRPISAFKRAATEPASRYVSLKQSQAARDREDYVGDEGHKTSRGDDEDEDIFEEQSSHIRQMKRLKERQDRINDQLRRLSSPELPALSDIKASAHLDTISRTDAQSTSSHILLSTENDPLPRATDIESEAETEQEEDHVGRSQQPESDDNHGHDNGDDDKENHLVNVPRTVSTRRLHNFMNRSVSEIEASPSARPTSYPSQAIIMHSSAFQDVPNSQPGDERRRIAEKYAIARSSDEPLLQTRHAVQTDADADRMSSDIRLDASDMDDQHPKPSDGVEISRENSKRGVEVRDSSTVGLSAPSIVPETDSNRRNGRADSTKTGTTAGDTSSSAARYETAPNERDTGDDMSSQPVSKTPPGKRRRRLMDISAEPSPLKSTPSFNAREALQLEKDPEVVRLLADSPRKHRGMSAPDNSTKARTQDSDAASKADESEAVQPNTETGPESSQLIVPPTRKHRVQKPMMQSPVATPDAGSPPRPSIWDFTESPVKRLPRANERKKMPRPAKRISRIEDRLNPKPTLPSSPEPPEQNIAPDHIASVADLVDSEGSHSEIVAPNMVFACFNGKVRAYYPAMCLGALTGNNQKYRIQWEGYDPDEVDAYGVAGLDLRVGDAIKVNLQTFPKVPYIVRGFKDRIDKHSSEITDIRGHRTLIVTPKQRKNLPVGLEPETRLEVQVKAIYLDNNMWGQVKNRHFEFKPEEKPVSVDAIATPVDRAMTPSTPSSRRRHQTAATMFNQNNKGSGLFTTMAFAVSYDDVVRKNRLVELIHEQGGIILSNSFDELLDADSSELQNQFVHLGFTVLLTEAYSRKEKYMQALALDLPCLSGTWVEACVREQMLVDWDTYLLPAGESNELDGAVRSRLMPSFAPGAVKLADMISQRKRLLHGASVIVVVGRGKSEIRWSKYVFLIRVLGATKIQTVVDAKAAQAIIHGEISCDWVFVDDKDVTATRDLLRQKSAGHRRSKTQTAHEATNECSVAGQELIVQSLILGKLSTRDML